VRINELTDSVEWWMSTRNALTVRLTLHSVLSWSNESSSSTQSSHAGYSTLHISNEVVSWPMSFKHWKAKMVSWSKATLSMDVLARRERVVRKSCITHSTIESEVFVTAKYESLSSHTVLIGESRTGPRSLYPDSILGVFVLQRQHF
jgi:hypothetical protein